MQKEYTIQQSLDENTVRKAASKLLFTKRLMTAAIACFFVLLLNGVGIYEDLQQKEYGFLTFFPLIICAFLVIALLNFFNKKVKTDYRKNIRFHKNITFTFSGEGIYAKGEGFENRTPWSDCEKIEETDDWLLIYKSKQQYQIIDKKQIRDIDMDELRFFFRSLEQQIKVSLK